MRKLNSTLVLNKDTKCSIANVTLNFLAAQTRIEKLEGLEHTVVPMVMLTEGVHSGSIGPVYYPKDELAKTPEVWNHKPVVVYHPTMNGRSISACDPDVINARKVGVVMNAKFEDGKLKAEAWIRNDRAEVVDERIMTAVNTAEMMELSTGLFIDVEPGEGSFESTPYAGVARNFRPDHLALLPDQIGACSIQDGAGFLRNKKECKALLTALSVIGILDPKAVFPNFVIYEKEGKTLRHGFASNKDGEVKLDETAVEVEVQTEYISTNKKTIDNKTPNKVNIMEPEILKLVDAIVGNTKWSDQDRNTLGSLPVAKLTALAEVKTAAPSFTAKLVKNDEGEDSCEMVAPKAPDTKKVDNKADADKKAADEKAAAEKLAANKKASQTVDEYIAAAPEGLRDVLGNGLSMLNASKVKLVASIIANDQNAFSEEDLNSRPLSELQKIAALMAPAKVEGSEASPNYGGQGFVPAANAGGAKEEAMEMPVMNFDKK